MLDVVDLFKERDTRDELGLGSVRDSFADQLFPGTSTIMTRARYFLLVPWTYQSLEAKKIATAAIGERARKAETTLIELIEASGDSDGNIGKVARNRLKRLPSSVYWQGLGVWGIRTFPGSLAQYHRSLDNFYKHHERHGGRRDERDSEHDDLARGNWHGGLVRSPAEFPGVCSLSLSRSEAEYLRERILLSPRCSGSLLAELANRPRQIENVEFIWEHPDLARFPQPLRELVEHGHRFSELMHGAALIYNLILAELTKSAELTNSYTERLADWAELMDSRADAFRKWERNEFWGHVEVGNPRVTPGTRDFITAWWQLVLTQEPARLATAPIARNLITERERRLKKGLARIDNQRARELWNGDAGSAQLEYRWTNSRRILMDIFAGLEVSDA